MGIAELGLLISLKDMATSQLTSFGNALSDVGKTGEKTSMGMGYVTGSLVSLAFMAVAAGGALFGITMKVVDNITQLEKLSIMTGFSVNTLQALQYAADVSKVKIETITTAMYYLALRMDTASSSGSRIGITLKELGIDYEEFRKMTPEEQFLILAEAIGKVEDAARQAQILYTFFGIGAKELAPIMKDLLNLMEEGAKRKKMFSDEDLEKVNKLHIAMINLKTAWGKLMESMSILTMPAFEWILNILTKFVEAMNRAGSAVLAGVLSLGIAGTIIGGPPGGVLGAIIGALLGTLLGNVIPEFQGWEGAIPGPLGKPYLATVHGGEIISQSGKMGGSINANIYVAGSVISERDLTEVIRQNLLRLQYRMNTTGIG